ncbi:MAG: histidine kinase [Planctomycetota bacterium]
MPVAQITGQIASKSASDMESVDARMLVFVRCALALTAFITWIPVVQYGKWIAVTYASLMVYCVYSVIVALNAYRRDWPTPGRAYHWIDVLFYGFMVEITAGSSSTFFYFFFFAIMIASLSRGLREGVAITLISVAIFVATMELNFGPETKILDFGRTMIRPIFLLVFGCLIAYWGAHEFLSRRRLKLLLEINRLWNPRFGVDHAIASYLQRLLEFYGADSCILALRGGNTLQGCTMYRAAAGKPRPSMLPSAIDEEAAEGFFRLPATFAAFYHDPTASWRNRIRGHGARDLGGRAQSKSVVGDLAELANLFDTQALITVPYAQRNGRAGRLYVISPRGGFTQSDIDLLVQVSSAISANVENTHLMEELISKASEHERRKISRDLHDTTIQPYIGLVLGLGALQREAGSGNPVAPHIAALIDMADMTIRDLRNYAATLKEKTSMPGDSLIAAVNEQAERMQRFYGIDVEVGYDLSAQLTGRIAGEAFQIIAEGLSNVLRHSTSKRAFVDVRCDGSSLLLKIVNDAAADGPDAAEFTPRSIHERTQELGGQLLVERRADGCTVVSVTIPM